MLKEESCQPRILYPMKISFSNGEEVKTFSEKEKLRICYQEAYTETTAKRKSLNIKEMIKEGILEHQEGNIE